MLVAKRFLSRIYNINKRMQALEQEIKVMRCQLYDIQATDYSKDKVCGGSKSDISDIIIKINDALEKRNAQWDKLVDVREEVNEVLESVTDNTLHTLLKERYVNGRTWEQVTILIDYSSRVYVSKTLHKKALKEVSKILKQSTKKNIAM